MPGTRQLRRTCVLFEAVPAAVQEGGGGIAARPWHCASMLASAHRRCSGAGSGGPRRFWVLIRWKAEVLQLVASSPDTPEDVVIITGPLSSLVSVGLALAGGLSIADSFGVNLEPVSTPPPPPPPSSWRSVGRVRMPAATPHVCQTRRSLAQARSSHSCLKRAEPAAGEAAIECVLVSCCVLCKFLWN